MNNQAYTSLIRWSITPAAVVSEGFLNMLNSENCFINVNAFICGGVVQVDSSTEIQGTS